MQQNLAGFTVVLEGGSLVRPTTTVVTSGGLIQVFFYGRR
jgi:hypothetical protein